MCCSMLRCVAVCGSAVQRCRQANPLLTLSGWCVAVCCSVLSCVAARCGVLQCHRQAAPHSRWMMCCSVLQRVVVCCGVLQHYAACCCVSQCVAFTTLHALCLMAPNKQCVNKRCVSHQMIKCYSSGFAATPVT